MLVEKAKEVLDVQLICLEIALIGLASLDSQLESFIEGPLW